MIDWTKSMQQSFEYYIVDPYTWHDIEKIDKVRSCTITRDLSLDTLGSATMECDENLNDKYVRAYLIATQHGEVDKVPLGCHIYQSPATAFDGKRTTISYDGYTPLIELKEKPMQIGMSVPKNSNILNVAAAILSDNSLRAPVVTGSSNSTLTGDFLSDVSDTRLSFLSDLLANAKFTLGLDELGRVIFVPDRDLASMQPRWTFNDDNSSILFPELTITRDIFGIPNKIEVIYSQADKAPIIASYENNDPESILSYQKRGRWIIHRETDPDVVDGITLGLLKEYAHNKLKELSTIDYKLTYTHGFCPDVRLGDCVRMNYQRADFRNENAKVIRQVIKCDEGCVVEETAVLTEHLWKGEE